ncbi:AI-2E family transporter [Actinomycetospora cinnamomea]|uniref:Putative PurR-regulated permease PerM n=1 Tax=Actinomycetospora cinnamomea TaxID=663609 RepID=A0A2U1EZP6_9PSEU|nr:AI-2E family transporter [Actinomycetospora cinnamomea]PVZ05395.1 putative PurR-regulated permease PerM [Actinomycetospora cinnamomea]
MSTPTEAPDAGPRAGSSSRRTAAGVPRALMLLLGAAAIVITIAGLQAGAWLIAPILLALVVVIAVSPIQGWMRRRGLPAWSTVLALLVVIFGVILGLVWVLLASVGQLVALLPQYADRIQQLTASVSTALTRAGFDPAQARQTASSADLGQILGAVGGVLSGLSGALTSIVFILALLLFLVAEANGTARRLDDIGADRPHMVSALQGFARGTRRYLVVTAVFGLIVAVLDSIALAIMGIPLVVLWGLLSFITNFIPNIGFVIGVIPPAVLGLLIGGWQTGLAVVGVYIILNALVQSVIQPRFTGDAVGLSTVVTFVALLFWAWVLGPLGALLAIPATLLIKAVLVDCDPSARWVEALIGSGSSPSGGTHRAEPDVAGDRTDGPDREPADEPVIPPPAPRTAPVT